MKTAVLYLRVSTTSQVQTDYDPEGISIPAQRVACQRKADQIGVTVLAEFVEPGRSGTTIDKRPVFQDMLAQIKHDLKVDYVIVYNLSRLNRNRIDDAKVMVLMRSLNVTLVSATENIDATPAGQLMHGILAAFNEYRSNSDGADIRYKMGAKAKRGGTVTRAKIGYLNVGERIDGYEVRTVAIDAERAPFIRLAFELASTGEYNMVRLAEILSDRGLTMRPHGGRTGRPLSHKYLTRILRDRYYLGIVVYDGEEYTGRHEPLITAALFDAVQRVLDVRDAKAGQRERKHDHYLKSLIWCGKCHEKGVDSRLIYTRTIGHGGEYWYYRCTARQDRQCDAPHLPVHEVEAAVVRHFATLRVAPEYAGRTRALLRATVLDEIHSGDLMRSQVETALCALEVKEENLLDLVAEGGTTGLKVRARLAAISADRDRLQVQLGELGPRLERGAGLIEAALDLLDDPQALYKNTTDPVRRRLNQVFFEKLYIDAPEVIDDVLRDPFVALVPYRALRRPSTIHKRSKAPTRNGAPKGAVNRRSTSVDLLHRVARDGGWSKATLVGDTGIEPVTPTVST